MIFLWGFSQCRLGSLAVQPLYVIPIIKGVKGNSMPQPSERQGLNPVGKKEKQSILLIKRDSITCKKAVSLSARPTGVPPHAPQRGKLRS